MTQTAQIDIDHDSAELLASLDTRGVSDRKLQLVFQCTAEELRQCRETDVYKEAMAAAQGKLEQQAAALDEGWNNVESMALSDLRDQLAMGAMSDPRQLLATAATANKMSRRALPYSTSGIDRAKAQTDRVAVLQGAQQVVIKLRTKFIDTLNTQAGHAKLVERESAIELAADHKIAETLSASAVREHLTNSLGVPMEQLKTGGAFGPDMFDIAGASRMYVAAPEETAE